MKTVCINQLDDGTFSVELEPAEGMEAPEMPEGAPGEMQADAMAGEAQQVFASIDEALDAARGMFEEGGEGGKPLMDGEADFVAGFANMRGKNGGF